MKLAVAFAALLLGLSLPAAADVTLRTTTRGTGTGNAAGVRGTIAIKGDRLRSDVEAGGRVRTMILDLAAQRIYTFESTGKEATVWEASALAGVLQAVDDAEVEASVAPNGETKTLDGNVAHGHDVRIAVTTPFPAVADARITATLTGWVRMVDGPGAVDYSRFYSAAARARWFFNDPNAASKQPGAARAMAELYRRIAELRGIPQESEIRIAFAGTGPLAAALQQVDAITTTTVVDEVSTVALPDDLFLPPAGYAIVPAR
jgi:hypothetical protein